MNAETLKGHLDLLLLSAVQPGPAHGYAIAEQLRARSSGTFDLPEGTLYPALHRLENRGWLTAEWRPSDTGRDAKFYKLTRKGCAQMAREEAAWARLAEAVKSILGGAEGEPT